MSRKFLTPIDLNQNQLLNAALQNLASDPGSPVAGQVYYNTGGNIKVYNGSSWLTVTTGTIGALTFNNGGTGVSSGSTYTGAPITVSYNSIGAAPTASPTFTGTITTPLTTAGIVLTNATGALSSTATIADSYLATISTAGKVLNSATTATNANTASAIVARDASGNFTANTVTANLSGTATYATTANAVAVANVSGLGTGVATALAVNTGSAGAVVVNGGALGTPSSGTLTNATGYKVDNLANTGANVITFLQTPSSANFAAALTDESGTGTVAFTASPTFTGTVTVPTPVNGTDAANKAYVDNVASGVNAHDAVNYATTTTLAAVYAAGTTGGDGGTGVGATITFSSTGATAIDGATNLVLSDRVLVKNGVTAASGTSSIVNGIYIVTTAGTTGVATVLTRATDADNSVLGDVAPGDLVYVISGTTNGGTQWIETATGTATNRTIKIGTDAITFGQFSGASTATAGAGLVANAAAFDVVGTANRITVTADAVDIASTYVGQTSITTLGNVTSGTWSASIVGPTYGGTGVNNGSKTITLGGNLTTSGAFNTTLTVTADTNVTLPTSGTLVNSAVATLSSLTSVGTIGTGTWQANAVAVLYGGTGATTASGARSNLGATGKYAVSNGAITAVGGSVTWTVTHNLNTTDVVAQVYQASTSAQVEVDVVTTSANVVTVTFNSASLTGSEYRVVVVG